MRNSNILSSFMHKYLTNQIYDPFRQYKHLNQVSSELNQAFETDSILIMAFRPL